MRFGLFYELQMPRPWGPGAEEKLFNEALEQIELADRLGFDYVWEVEHHFLEEYSHSSAPEVFLAAASQRTKRIRLGHGIVQLPPGFNHPARVAERIATLDLVSGGRVEFGTGQASSQAELGGFGVDRELKHAQWEEALDVIVCMMTEEPFAGYEGRFFSMPPRNVVPKPKQRPHPPLWVACSRRETIPLAARKGLGALSFSFVEPEQAKEWVDEYYALIASPECVPAGLTVNPQVAVVLPFMCHEDEQTAIDRGIDGAHFFGFSLAYYYVFGKHQPGTTNIWNEFVAHRKEYGFARELISPNEKPLSIKLLEQGLGSFRGAVGTPSQILELVERYERAGVDLMIFAAQAGPNRHEHICEGLELFAKTVLPRFAERACAREAEKRERLAAAVEQALARRSSSRSTTRGYVITPQGETGPAGTLRVYAADKDGKEPATSKQRHRSGGQAVLVWLVRGRSDKQLERMMPFLAPLIFKGMERAFRPDRAFGFSGEIEYVLESNGKSRKWVVQIADGKAIAKTGPASHPSMTLRMSAPTFARLSAGILEPVTAAMEKKIEVVGDLRLMNRLVEMFGGSSGY
jgi:alkanesulfonate monooxygenase SsuD/methylene tetrahydromethanopterin reductase-like flavin-dependent oxidoreductase (luciferase family)/putative sterol carrier protein